MESRFVRKEVSRLNKAITEEEQKINAIFQRMGQVYFAAHRDDPEENQADSIRAILECVERGKKLKDQINELRGIAVCRNCGAEVDRRSAFCNRCGMRMPLPNSREEKLNPGELLCLACGNHCAPGTNFCNRCGARLVKLSQEEAAQAETPATDAVHPESITDRRDREPLADQQDREALTDVEDPAAALNPTAVEVPAAATNGAISESAAHVAAFDGSDLVADADFVPVREDDSLLDRVMDLESDSFWDPESASKPETRPNSETEPKSVPAQDEDHRKDGF